MKHLFLRCALAALLGMPLLSDAGEPVADPPQSQWAEIRVTEAATGRGIPLVELETVNHLRFVTDGAGRVAFLEPGLMGREIYFSVRSHGYDVPKDGFGFAGVRVTPQAGKIAEIKLTRRNAAERLCRLTGEGIYRDSILLGYDPPRPDSSHPGRVAGQDSIASALYRDKVYWFWGDTQRMEYPLGLFRVAGATTPLPKASDARSDPVHGLPFDYFVDAQTGFAQAMMPLPERPDGAIWISAVFTVPDEQGKERLIGHYSRRKSLEVELEHGIAIFRDDWEIFEPAVQLPLSETWRRPSGHPIAYEEAGSKWILFGSPTPHVRAPANLKDILNPGKYEAFTCAKPGTDEPNLDVNGQPEWRWQTDQPPVSSKTEQAWVKAGKLKAEHARFYPADGADQNSRIVLHSGSVRWNAHRKRWVMIAGQIGGTTSMLGEVWYAEADSPTGPFAKAVKVVTHDRQSFYNVCHHAFLDRSDGRFIYFEGTYTNDFSGNLISTPRYNYNQVLYRLDLDHAVLTDARSD